MRAIVRTAMLIVCCVAAGSLYAQVTEQQPADTATRKTHVYPNAYTAYAHVVPKKPKPITHEWSAGFRLNSDGWSFYSDYGRVKTKDIRHIDMFHNVRFWQFELSEKKSPKEQKLSS